MKCAMVIAHGVKQIMLSAENAEEKAALALIEPSQEITLDIKSGTFYDGNIPDSARAFRVQQCKDGYMRAYNDDGNSVMLVLRPKDPPAPPAPPAPFPLMEAVDYILTDARGRKPKDIGKVAGRWLAKLRAAAGHGPIADQPHP